MSALRWVGTTTAVWEPLSQRSAVLLSSQIPGRVNALGPVGLALDDSRGFKMGAQRASVGKKIDKTHF